MTFKIVFLSAREFNSPEWTAEYPNLAIHENGEVFDIIEHSDFGLLIRPRTQFGADMFRGD